jgi:hypothetical protein
MHAFPGKSGQEQLSSAIFSDLYREPIMKATRLRAYGDTENFKYEDVPDPVPAARQ